jgi:hypothetical protein
VSHDAPESIFCSDWAANYGNPYLEAPASPMDADITRIVEDDGVLRAHEGGPLPALTLVFVDGVRRMEAHLTAERAGTVVRGVAGAHGVGAVVCIPGKVPRFERCASRRYLVWEAGQDVHLPSHPSGFSWEVHSIAPGASALSADAGRFRFSLTALHRSTPGARARHAHTIAFGKRSRPGSSASARLRCSPAQTTPPR